MIALASDCLVFHLASGESVPFSAEMLSTELMGEAAESFEPEFVQHAAHAVIHYFKHELGRQSVSVAEFAEAIEKVLRGFKPSPPQRAQEAAETAGSLESDLCRLACESGAGCELFFFPRLRDELRRQLSQSPRLLRFRGLRGCVKQLTGARRWSLRCRTLEERIVEYLRECAEAEAGQTEFALVVD
jgi:hypothetical protein